MDERNAEKVPTFAAIYARTSSANQRFNYSIREQVNRCWKHCGPRGWMVRYIFVDEGESGKTVVRPKFQLMLKKARAGMFDVIVFWKLDRLCRSLVDLVNVEKVLREWGVGLCSVTEFIDTTTSIGRFNFRSIASVAELERELIGERARLGLHALAKEHKWPNPHPPLGYDKSEDGKLIVNESEAKLVHRIFGAYVQQQSMPQVAFELNEEGILTKKGKEWNARAVRDVLTNGIYIGRYSVAGVEDYVEDYRIVDGAVLKKVNETRLRYKKGGAKRPPMPETRKMAKIDRVFNDFLKLLNSQKENLDERSGYKVRVTKNEKELFRLLQEGWDLTEIVNDKFMIGKSFQTNQRAHRE